MSHWSDELCEYYNITPEEALELGTRSKGRRPNFPSSISCPNPPQGKTFEEIWDEKPRDTFQQKMDFYKDCGPWQVFRQTQYRLDFDYSVYFPHFDFSKDSLCILEYGCGITHLTNHIVNKLDGNIPPNVKFILVDVPGEHMEYAKWRLKKKAPNVDFEFHEITEKYPLPEFKSKIDFTLMTDVLEHLPNPFDVIKNITEHSNPKAKIIETWHHEGDDYGYADLEEAVLQRDETLKYMEEHYKIVGTMGAGDIRVREIK